MTTSTKEFTNIPTLDHECPYKDRLVRVSPIIGSRTYLLDQLVKIHENEECPATHIDTSPTRVWSEWIEDTAV